MARTRAGQAGRELEPPFTRTRAAGAPAGLAPAGAVHDEQTRAEERRRIVAALRANARGVNSEIIEGIALQIETGAL